MDHKVYRAKRKINQPFCPSTSEHDQLRVRALYDRHKTLPQIHMARRKQEAGTGKHIQRQPSYTYLESNRCYYHQHRPASSGGIIQEQEREKIATAQQQNIQGMYSYNNKKALYIYIKIHNIYVQETCGDVEKWKMMNQEKKALAR